MNGEYYKKMYTISTIKSSHIAWHLEHIQKLEQAFKPYMNEAYQVIKN